MHFVLIFFNQERLLILILNVCFFGIIKERQERMKVDYDGNRAYMGDYLSYLHPLLRAIQYSVVKACFTFVVQLMLLFFQFCE